MTNRCEWANSNPLYVAYHDEEWGVPQHDDQRLFEALVLDGAQAGLSRITILRKRDAYRAAFDGFVVERVARYNERRIQELLTNAGIVRNRRKIESAVYNARMTLQVQNQFGSLDAYLWGFVDGMPRQNAWRTWSDIPAQTPLSETMSKDWWDGGFKFVGPIICYAIMQSVGMVNDHVVAVFATGNLEAVWMPVELTNFTVWGRQWFGDGWNGLRALCAETGLAGIELLASGATPETAPPVDLIRGIHLRSLGSWLPLVGVDVPDFGAGSNRYAACETYARLVETRADELRQMAVFDPDYVVWHGVYAPFPFLVSGRPRISAGHFLEHLVGLVRDVCSRYRPPYKVLFENAFGVESGPAAMDETATFLDELGDLPVGLVLDIGHHLNTRRDIESSHDACQELLRLAESWCRHGLAAEVLHLHWTPPHEVAPQLTEEAVRDFASQAESAQREAVASSFFARSDRHLPLDDPQLAAAVGALSPAYVVHEMGALSLEDHRLWLMRQAQAMRGTDPRTGREAI